MRLRELWDWRRRVAAMYAAVRAEPDPEAAWLLWRQTRDALFREHPQSPLDAEHLGGFATLPFFPYDEALRFTVGLAPAEGAEERCTAGADGEVRLVPFAVTQGLAPALGAELTLYWMLGYCGGVFLPFADATSSRETYGGGRYLLDTIKSADLGETPDGQTLLDFNFAYNPSCAYSASWTCPLSPRANRLPQAVRAGELTPELARLE